jgi:hypothetical protein
MSIPFIAGAVSKLFLQFGCSEVRVEGLPAFVERLQGERGVLTSEFPGQAGWEAAQGVEELADDDSAPTVLQSPTISRCKLLAKRLRLFSSWGS